MLWWQATAAARSMCETFITNGQLIPRLSRMPAVHKGVSDLSHGIIYENLNLVKMEILLRANGSV